MAILLKPRSLGRVIASRKYFLEDNKKKTIVLKIGMPRKIPGRNDYYCPFQILGDESNRARVKAAYGIDAIQVLVFAISMLGNEMDYINKRNGNKLRWSGGEVKGLDMPWKKMGDKFGLIGE